MLGALLLIITIIIEYIRDKKFRIYGKIDIFSLFTIYVSVYFYLQDFLLFLLPQYNSYIVSGVVSRKIILLIVFIFYCLCLISYNFFYKKKWWRSFKYSSIDFDTIIKAFQILFVASIILYTLGHGGILGALNAAQIQRSGHGTYGVFDFFKRFFYIGIPITCYHAYVFKINRTVSNCIRFAVYFTITFLAFSLLAGRTNIAILILLTVYVLVGNAKLLKYLILILPFYYFIQIADNFFVGFQKMTSIADLFKDDEISKSSKTILDFFNEFSYGYNSLISVLSEIETVQLSFFNDFIYSVVELLPNFLYNGGTHRTVAYLNTFIQTGIFDSTIPPGIVAYSVFAFGLAGLVIGPILYGFMGVIFGQLAEIFTKHSIGYFNAYICFIWFAFAQSGEPRVFLNAFIINIVFFILILQSNKIKMI